LKAAVAVLLLACRLPAGEIPDALLSLEAVTPFGPGQGWNAAPVRFALLADGQVFVGGSKEVLAGRLEKPEIKPFEARLAAVRKLPGLASVVDFGGEKPAFRLRVSKGRPLDVRITGDPAKAAPAFRPLVALLESMLRFDHPSLRPFAPASFALLAREAPATPGAFPGGCRLWTLVPTPAEAASPIVVSASAVSSWVGGIYPTSVCVGDTRYEVRLRPLLPGERP
jgi:hypothetical protein